MVTGEGVNFPSCLADIITLRNFIKIFLKLAGASEKFKEPCMTGIPKL